MRIAFFVNDLKTEEPGYTTTRLSMGAHNRNHEVFYVTPESFALDPDNLVRARAVTPPQRTYNRGRSISRIFRGKRRVVSASPSASWTS